MVADLLIANLLRIAREDLDGATMLAPRGNRNAAYLCLGQRSEPEFLGRLCPDAVEGSPKKGQRAMTKNTAVATGLLFALSIFTAACAQSPAPPEQSAEEAVRQLIVDAASARGDTEPRSDEPSFKPQQEALDYYFDCQNSYCDAVKYYNNGQDYLCGVSIMNYVEMGCYSAYGSSMNCHFYYA